MNRVRDEFKYFKEKCKALGVNYARALKRRQAGMPDEKIFTKGIIGSALKVTIPISIYGIEYPNLMAAVNALNPPASAASIKRWIASGISPEDAFERIPNPGYASGLIYLVTNKIDDKKYVGLTIQTIERRWIYHNDQANAGHIKNDDSLHAAIRKHGSDAFEITILDQGISKKDLEEKERFWIKKLETLVPNGYNLCPGGVSGGSNKKPISIDGKRFPGIAEAARHLMQTKSISYHAAKKRILSKRIHVRKPAKPGESIIKTSAYKAWSAIIHTYTNPKSRDFNPNVSVCEKWRDFDVFLSEVGQPPGSGMCFARIDKAGGFFPDNCRWMTKSESSKINAAYMKETGRLTGRKRKIS